MTVDLKSQSLSHSCSFIDSLFNNDQIKSTFRLGRNKDSLQMIDKRQWITIGGNSFKWDGKYVKIVNDSLVINKISRKEPFNIFREDCTIFIFDGFEKKGTSYHFSILQPCSGLLTEAVFKLNKNTFKLILVKKFVL
jgi:hypothetical protein